MVFSDRNEAAELLIDKLKKYKGLNPLVLGIPRGAMPMAEIIAKGLEGELSTILVHKIPHPTNKEFAVGSIGLSGHIHRLPYIESYHISEEYIQSAAKRELEMLNRRREKYHLKKEADYQDRIVIIVDDGIATGATTIGAILEARIHKPKTLVLAAGVASRESIQQIKPMVDDMVILSVPEPFFGVGQFFEDFSQVTDEEVVEILKRSSNYI